MKRSIQPRSNRAPVIADYALYSLTNFVLGIAVARVANLSIFAVYALLFQLCNFGLVMIRAALGETWLVTQSDGDSSRQELRPAVPTAFACSLGLGLVPVFVVIAALLTDVGSHLGVVLALALALPALVAQDTHRFVCFASRRPWRAVFSETSWLATQTLLLAFMAAGLLPQSPGWAALAWTLGAYAALFIIGAGPHLNPRLIAPGFRWWKTNRRVGKHLAVETLGGSMVGPLIAVGLFVMGQELALGVLRGASILFSPILVLAQGMRTALTKRTPEGRRDSLLGPRALLATTSLAWGGILFAAPGVGRLILGGLWGPSIRQIVLLEAVARIGLASAAIDSARLRRQSTTLAAATLGFWSGGLVVTAALFGAWVGDFFGAALGSAGGYALAAVTWRYVCRRTGLASEPKLQAW